MTNEPSENNSMEQNTTQPQADQGAAVLVGYGTLLARCSERKTMKDGSIEIHCKLGLWGVSGQDHRFVEREAEHYFAQYLEDGEYNALLANIAVSQCRTPDDKAGRT
jgi:hypothetical protein